MSALSSRKRTKTQPSSQATAAWVMTSSRQVSKGRWRSVASVSRWSGAAARSRRSSSRPRNRRCRSASREGASIMVIFCP